MVPRNFAGLAKARDRCCTPAQAYPVGVTAGLADHLEAASSDAPYDLLIDDYADAQHLQRCAPGSPLCSTIFAVPPALRRSVESGDKLWRTCSQPQSAACDAFSHMWWRACVTTPSDWLTTSMFVVTPMPASCSASELQSIQRLGFPSSVPSISMTCSSPPQVHSGAAPIPAHRPSERQERQGRAGVAAAGGPVPAAEDEPRLCGWSALVRAAAAAPAARHSGSGAASDLVMTAALVPQWYSCLCWRQAVVHAAAAAHAGSLEAPRSL